MSESSRRSISTSSGTSVKDANGAYLPSSTVPPISPTSPVLEVDISPETDSIDGMLKTGLSAIYRAMRSVHSNISSGAMGREDIQNLKDLMTLLQDLKKKEKDFLDGLTEEELEKLVK